MLRKNRDHKASNSNLKSPWSWPWNPLSGFVWKNYSQLMFGIWVHYTRKKSLGSWLSLNGNCMNQLDLDRMWGRSFSKVTITYLKAIRNQGKKGKAMEDRDEEASSGREEVMGNMNKACVTWLSAAFRKLGIFRNWFFCTQFKKSQKGIHHDYMHINIWLYFYYHLPWSFSKINLRHSRLAVFHLKGGKYLAQKLSTSGINSNCNESRVFFHGSIHISKGGE